jgi:hydrogenase nickel incorporation protein HypA/HybF
MHEIRLASELAGIVTEVAVRENLKRVSQVNLQFGEMIQVVPDIFRFAFNVAVAGTCAEDAEVNIETVPITLRCKDCGEESIISDLVFRCANCLSADLEIVHGKEMVIKSLEGE